MPSTIAILAILETYTCIFFLLLLPLWSIGLIYQFLDYFTDGRTPWTGDQLVARPLPVHKHRKTSVRAHTHTHTHTHTHVHTQTLNIHVLSGIRTYDPDFRASENGACLRPLVYRDRLHIIRPKYFIVLFLLKNL
jgi:hypothetical protein